MPDKPIPLKQEKVPRKGGVRKKWGRKYKRKLDAEEQRFSKKKKILINRKLDAMRKRMLAEMRYASLYGSANLHGASVEFYLILYSSGEHVAEYYRRFGREAYEALGSLRTSWLEKDGLDLYLSKHEPENRQQKSSLFK